MMKLDCAQLVSTLQNINYRKAIRMYQKITTMESVMNFTISQLFEQEGSDCHACQIQRQCASDCTYYFQLVHVLYVMGTQNHHCG